MGTSFSDFSASVSVDDDVLFGTGAPFGGAHVHTMQSVMSGGWMVWMDG